MSKLCLIPNETRISNYIYSSWHTFLLYTTLFDTASQSFYSKMTPQFLGRSTQGYEKY